MEPIKLTCFLALPPARLQNPQLVEAIKAGVFEAGYTVVSLDERPVMMSSSIQEALISELALADCIIADISYHDPIVFFELGLALAMEKGILIIAEERWLENVPLDNRAFRAITYSNERQNMNFLSKQIFNSLLEIQRFPLQKAFSSNLQNILPFFTDWDRLSTIDVENLCQELLVQIGFRRLEWEKATPDIDIIAELPKKDPDGYEYRELWLVSLGLRVPIDLVIDMANEPDYFLYRLMKRSDRFEEMFSKKCESITLLFVLFKTTFNADKINMLNERFEKRRKNRESFKLNIRIRIWDQDYLTSLVQRFPQIGYKYFSNEGRIRSQTHNNYEELYNENSLIYSNLAKLNSELQEEKNIIDEEK